MPPFYVVEQGSTLRCETRRLLVVKDEQTLASAPLVHVSQVVVFGNVNLTTPLIKTLLAEGIEVVFLTLHGQYCGRLIGPPTKFGALRHRQTQRVDDKAFALATAQAIVAGKLRNCRTLLMRYNRDLNDAGIGAAIDRLGEFIERAPHTTQLSSLMGVEGSGAALYFGVFKKLFKHDWRFEKRVRRPPTDPINVLLSFAYTLLLQQVESAVLTVGLDPYLGFLHGVEYGRPSLALDVMEEFRPIVADSVVLRVCNEGLITPENFAKGDDPDRPVVLDEAGRKRLLQEFEARLQTEFKHPLSDERVTYRRCFELQVRDMARGIQSGAVYRPFLVR